MEKYNESNINGRRFYKYYKFDDQYTAKDFVRDINKLNMSNISITVRDDVELSMIPLSGTYDYEDINENYDYFIKSTANIKDFEIILMGTYNGAYTSIHIKPAEQEIVLVSSLNNIEINDIIKKETKQI